MTEGKMTCEKCKEMAYKNLKLTSKLGGTITALKKAKQHRDRVKRENDLLRARLLTGAKTPCRNAEISDFPLSEDDLFGVHSELIEISHTHHWGSYLFAMAAIIADLEQDERELFISLLDNFVTPDRDAAH